MEQERQRGPKIKIEAAGSDEGPGARLDVPRSSQLECVAGSEMHCDVLLVENGSEFL